MTDPVQRARVQAGLNKGETRWLERSSSID